MSGDVEVEIEAEEELPSVVWEPAPFETVKSLLENILWELRGMHRQLDLIEAHTDETAKSGRRW